MGPEEIERLESRIASLEATHESAEAEARQLEARVRLADGLLERVGHAPAGWRLQLGFGAVLVAFVWGWFFGLAGPLEWLMACATVLGAAFAGVGVDRSEEQAWERVERARVVVPDALKEDDVEAGALQEEDRDAVPKRTRRV